MYKKAVNADLSNRLHPVTGWIGVLILGIIIIGLTLTENANKAEGVRLLEEAITRAAVHSYAVEGFYPPNLESINVFVDHRQFIVHYEAFASNILPDIRVFARVQ